jgi:hypothetical protein
MTGIPTLGSILYCEASSETPRRNRPLLKNPLLPHRCGFAWAES